MPARRHVVVEPGAGQRFHQSPKPLLAKIAALPFLGEEQTPCRTEQNIEIQKNQGDTEKSPEKPSSI